MILIISGTNRPECNALRVSKNIKTYYGELGAEADILNLQDLPAEIFDPKCYAEKPESFAPFQQKVLDAEGLHVVVPEYNGSFPGVLKYFIDMLKFPESFERKPVAFTGEAAGMWGSFRGVEQLQMVFGYRNALPLPERVWISGIFNKLDDAGEFTDELTPKLLKDQCKKFIDFIAATKSITEVEPQPR